MDQAAPPTSQSVPSFVVAETPRWPSFVGTISIVYAGLMLSCMACGLGFMFFAPALLSAAANQPGGLPPSMRPTPIMIANSAANILWFLVLLAAGIATVMRSPRGRLLHLIWGAGALALLLVGVLLQLQMRAAMQQWMAQNPGNPMAKPGDPVLELLMSIVMLLLFASWPVFCLIWFGFVKKSGASIAGAEAPGAFDAA